jgi:hypothetical protein
MRRSMSEVLTSRKFAQHRDPAPRLTTAPLSFGISFGLISVAQGFEACVMTPPRQVLMLVLAVIATAALIAELKPDLPEPRLIPVWPRVMPTQMTTPSTETPTMESNLGVCEQRMKSFVAELDELFTSNPQGSIRPFQALLKTYFPVRGCDVNRVLAIVRQSKFLFSIEEWPKEYAIVFDDHKLWRPGRHVSFGLIKDSGDSTLAAAVNNK